MPAHWLRGGLETIRHSALQLLRRDVGKTMVECLGWKRAGLRALRVLLPS